MKAQKRVMLAAILSAACGVWSTATIAGDRMEELADELGLFDDQIPQVEAVFAQARANRQALRQSASSEDRRAARAQLREQLALVLTAEQMEKFDTLLAERRSDRRQNSRNGRHRDDTTTM